MAEDARNEVRCGAQAVGTVYLVGAGPGDPGLITVRGLRVLRRADTVVYDSLAPASLLDEAPDARRVFVGKRGTRPGMAQDQINERLAAEALSGRCVVRLKGGDPFVFGRGAEEASYLAERGVPFEVVPGVTAGIAGPAYAGIPVTHRDYASSLALVTGHRKRDADSGRDAGAVPRIPAADTIVLYMTVRRLPHVVARILDQGLSPHTPVAIVQWATTPQQRTVTGQLSNIVARSAGIEAPAVLVVGEVVRLRERLQWFERRPLVGRTILVTRPAGGRDDLSREFAELGASVLRFPAVRIENVEDRAPLDRAIEALCTYDHVVLTSVNGVDRLFARLRDHGKDARALHRATVCAIGRVTAEALAQHGIRADLVPEEYDSGSLARAILTAGEVRGKRMLLVRSALASRALGEELERAGALCTEVALYRVAPARRMPAHVRGALAAGQVDMVTLTSASIARAFVGVVGEESAGELSRAGRLASIGPVTTRALGEMGLRAAAEATEHTASGLAAAVLNRLAGKWEGHDERPHQPDA